MNEIEGIKSYEQEDLQKQEEQSEAIKTTKNETNDLLMQMKEAHEKEIVQLVEGLQKLSYNDFVKHVKNLEQQYQKGFKFSEGDKKYAYLKQVKATSIAFTIRYEKARNNNDIKLIATIKKDALQFAKTISGKNDSIRMIAKKNIAPDPGSIINKGLDIIHEHPVDIISSVEMLVKIYEDINMSEDIGKLILPANAYEKPAIANKHKNLRSMLGKQGLGKEWDQAERGVFLSHTNILKANIDLSFDQLTFDQKIQVNLIIKTITHPHFAKNAKAGNRDRNRDLFKDIQEKEITGIVEKIKYDKGLQKQIENMITLKVKGLTGTDKEIADLIKSLGPDYEKALKKLNGPMYIEAGMGKVFITIIALLVSLGIGFFSGLGVAYSDNWLGTLLRRLYGVQLVQEQEVRVNSEGEINVETIEKLLKLQTVKGTVKDMSISAEYGDDLTDGRNRIKEKLNQSNKKLVQVQGDVTVNGEYDFQKGGLKIERFEENGKVLMHFELPPLSYSINTEDTDLKVGYQANGAIRWFDQALFGEGKEELNISKNAEKEAQNKAIEIMKNSKILEKDAEEQATKLFTALQQIHEIPRENIAITFNYADGSKKTVNGNGLIINKPQNTRPKKITID